MQTILSKSISVPSLDTIEEFATLHAFHDNEQVITASVLIVIFENIHYSDDILAITDTIMQLDFPTGFLIITKNLSIKAQEEIQQTFSA